MRIAEPIEKQGFFWPPGQEELKTPGTLKVARSGEVELDLFDLYTADTSQGRRPRLVPRIWPTDEEKKIRPRILGIIDAKPVTILKCHYRRLKGAFGGGISQATFRAAQAHFNVWHDDADDLRFTTVTFEFEGLHDWLQLTGLRETTDYSADHPPTVQRFTFSRPDDISIALHDGAQMTFGLSATLPSLGVGVTESTLTQQSYVRFSVHEPMHLRDFLDMAMKLQNFLSLANDQPINMTSIQGKTPETDQDTEQTLVDIYLDSHEYSNRSDRIAWHRTLFSYPEISDRFEDVFNSWLQHYSVAELAFNLYFAVSSNAYRNIEGEFLATVQAVEGLHRGIHPDEARMPEEDFKHLKNTVVKAAPKEYRDLVHSSLQFANQPSLRDRISQLIEPFSRHYGHDKEVADFARAVANGRNQLTHLLGNPDDSTRHLALLLSMTMKLEALFQLHLLRLLSLDDGRIDEIVEKHLQHKLNPEVE